MLAVNVAGALLCAREAVRRMSTKHGKLGGTIVNVSSIAARLGSAGEWVHYAASKGAINALTRALAVELAPRRINVNAVAPGVIDTEMSAAVRDMAGDEVRARILQKRYGKPEEIAYAVWFLASDYANYVTGQVLAVDGGFKMD